MFTAQIRKFCTIWRQFLNITIGCRPMTANATRMLLTTSNSPMIRQSFLKKHWRSQRKISCMALRCTCSCEHMCFVRTELCIEEASLIVRFVKKQILVLNSIFILRHSPPSSSATTCCFIFFCISRNFVHSSFFANREHGG